MDEVESAFSDETNADEFKRKYGGVKPSKEAYVIFYCRSGRRSQIALETARKLGYSK